MAGWSRDKRKKFEEAFYLFLNNCYVNSKNTGFTCLGENLYDGQRLFISTVLDGLEADIHKFYVLKSRQLGLSTISRALSVFYIGVHKGISGALVFDTAPNRELARAELETMIDDLPAKLKFPAVKATNREGLTLVTKSKILFKAAGVKKSAGSGGLGRSAGLSMAHLSELCSFTDPEGLESFENSLSDEHPDRLYIYESTARGFNLWHELWTEARKDTAHCSCLFLGWWSHNGQEIKRDHPDFELYGTTPPTDKERDKIRIVSERYGVIITPEKLAWIRRKMDPTATREGDADPEFEGNSLRIQEQPWTEEEAFQQTGSVFFPQQTLTEITHTNVSNKFSAWMFLAGTEFFDMKIIKAPNTRNIDLRIWEEPDPDGVYSMGVDPAFGENEYNDRSSIQIFRCYADGVDQVAEYASPLINTRQLAWVIATLLGYYGSGPNAQIKYALELNGPGTAVFNELRALKSQIDSGYQRQQIEEKGLQDIFRNVRTYIYTRPDGMGSGHNYHIKCLALDTPVPTPGGWTVIKDIQPGDVVFDEIGNPCSVVAVSETKENHACYRVTFDDGSTLVADSEHLWEVSVKRRRPIKYKMVKTSELSVEKHSVRVTQALVLPERFLPIDPYVLGVWLGDGYSASGRFCSHADDIEELSNYIQKAGFALGPRSRARTMDYRNIVGLIALLRSSNLWNNKHIPPEYLRASKAQRLALLQGLMDTDGTINPANGKQCMFATTNMQLARGFSELLRSLGIKAKSRTIKPILRYKGKDVVCSDAKYFNFTYDSALPPFRLRRKRKKAESVVSKRGPNPIVSKHHKIVSVERVESVPVRCIQVDSPSHLFLAGSSMVPTHNTTGPLKITFLERMRDFVTNGTCKIRSIELVDEMKTVAREGDSIKAPGNMKDDRVLSASFAIHAWETGLRKMLMTQKRTREAEAARKRLSIVDQVQLFQQNQLAAFFDQKRRVRVAAARQAIRQTWRYR